MQINRLNLGPVTGSLELVKQDTILDDNDVFESGPKKKPNLKSIINIRDFERAAAQILSSRSFGCRFLPSFCPLILTNQLDGIVFKAGADDEYTAQWNRDSWQAIRFRPRVLRPINHVDLTTSILGNTYSAPFFICPAGGAKLAHPSGEILLTKAAAKHDVLHWVCNNAGCTQQQITDVRAPSQTLYWQIYAVDDLAVTEREIKQAIAQGYKGFALTVDAIRAGKRERDVRISIEEDEVCADTFADHLSPYQVSVFQCQRRPGGRG